MLAHQHLRDVLHNQESVERKSNLEKYNTITLVKRSLRQNAFHQTLYSETLRKSADFPQENAWNCSGNLLSMVLKFGARFWKNSFLLTFFILNCFENVYFDVATNAFTFIREKSLNRQPCVFVYKCVTGQTWQMYILMWAFASRTCWYESSGFISFVLSCCCWSYINGHQIRWKMVHAKPQMRLQTIKIMLFVALQN